MTYQESYEKFEDAESLIAEANSDIAIAIMIGSTGLRLNKIADAVKKVLDMKFPEFILDEDTEYILGRDARRV